MWTGVSTFALPENLTVKGVRFMPFGAEHLGSTDTGYGAAVYSDIEYIGFFPNESSVELFDFKAYKYVVSKGIQIKKAFRGDDLNYPANSTVDVNTDPNYPRQNLSSSSTSVMWTEFGIPAATPEHGSCKFVDKVFCGSDDITAAVELYTNMILQQVNFDFKEKVEILKNTGN